MINDFNLVWGYMIIFYDVLFGTFADGNNLVGMLASFAELVIVNQTVYGFLTLWKATEYKVVDSHNAFDMVLLVDV